MNYQFYWKNWWKLWPSYNKLDGNDYKSLGQVLFFPDPIEHFFCFGAFQLRWKSTP